MKVPHIDFDAPTGNPQVATRHGYGLRPLNPAPPPYEPDLDAIRYIEDPWHGPSRRKTWRCWIPFRKCEHQRDET